MLGNLGDYELSAGDLDAARRHLAESLDIVRALNDRDGIVYETFNLGLAEYLGGSPGAAEALFAESLDLARRMGMKRAYRLRADRPGHGRPRRGRPGLVGPAARRGRPGPGGPGPHPPAAGRPAGRPATASGCAPRWAPKPSRPNTPQAAPSTWRRGWPRSGSRTRGRAGARAAGSDEAVTVLTPRELDVLKLVAQGSEQLRHRPAAFPERAHRPPAPGQHPAQARSLLPRRGRGLGRAHRAGVSLARSGHLPRPHQVGP